MPCIGRQQWDKSSSISSQLDTFILITYHHHIKCPAGPIHTTTVYPGLSQARHTAAAPSGAHMPTIHVNRDALYAGLGQRMTDEEFDELCFQFGIELDEVTSERQLVAKEQGTSKATTNLLSDDVIYRIEIPANRYDLLSTEGLVRALKAYLTSTAPPAPRTAPPQISVAVGSATARIRPFIACAVLRDIAMTPAIYDSLIELQDKLHSGLGRKRTIVSMGTYDLDTLHPNFTYDALDPQHIHFVPLNRTQAVDGHGLMETLESDLKLKKFLPIIRHSPIYPVLRDAHGTVLSVPPIINGDSSKITLGTRNIFIDVTGTDYTKVATALNVLVTSFSQYCAGGTVEQVTICRPDGSQLVTPDLSCRDEAISVDYINRSLGLALSASQICHLLGRMMLPAVEVSTDFIKAAIPPTRPDIIHACDVMEDVAIAYGFNQIPSRLPSTSTIGAPNPLNKLTDLLRREVALTGFSEVLTFSLCSRAENYDQLRKADPGHEAITLTNPKTLEFEVVHTSLIPAMLKTLASNKKMPLPLKIFQVADVCLQDPEQETGARNERRLCAAYCGMTSGLETIHGLLDRVMLMMDVPPAPHGYSIRPSALPTFFPGRQAEILLGERCIGAFGIVHPEVTAAFETPYVCSLLEINIEPLL